MRIEHVAVWTHDVDRLVGFYSRYFGATAGARYANSEKGFESRFLGFDGGARLEVMKTTTLSPVLLEPGTQRIGLTHLALTVGSESEVQALTERLRGDGHTVLEEPRWTGDGYYESVVLDPDGNRIEITV